MPADIVTPSIDGKTSIEESGRRHRPRIAFLGPLPPNPSGIADYSRDLLPALAKLADITLFTAKGEGTELSESGQFEVLHYSELAARRFEYDVLVYQMGNSDHHNEMYQVMNRFPGIVVLHDLFLHHFMAHRTAGAGNPAGYMRELAYAQGSAGVELARDIFSGRKSSPLFSVSLNNRIVDLALGVAVHSQFVADSLQEQWPDKMLATIPMPIRMIEGISRRDELNLPPEAVLFGSFGAITVNRQLPLVLEQFKRLRQENPNVYYLVVGAVQPEVDLDKLVDGLGLADAVIQLGRVPSLQDFTDWLSSVDVVINLRQPTAGETSATALRAMTAGRPMVVTDQGWYAELPDEAVIKVSPDDKSGLYEAMRDLVQNHDQRMRLGDAAAKYAVTNHDVATAARAYYDFILQVLDRISMHYA